MIDITVVLGWLKELGCSRMNSEVSRLTREYLWSAPSDSHVRLLLEKLRSTADASQDPLERGEVLLHCAAIAYWRNWFPASACYAQEAVNAYINDDRCRAVALWVLGMPQWKMLQNHKAYTNWNTARNFFQRYHTILQNSPNDREWYRKKIWKMNVECAAQPEEILTWLNQFEASSLRWSTQQAVKCVQEKIRQQAYPDLYALMQDWQETEKHSQQGYEKAEISLEFGLAFYQLGHMHSAIEFSRKAVENFYSGIRSYHKRVVARCMLGALEWQQKSSHNQAFLHWTRSIEEFEELRCWAERDNLEGKQRWYAEHRALLRVVLSECLPRQYQDLVFLVHDDLDEANRLIAWELGQFPQDVLSKLIERAIEHVLMGGT